MGQVISLSQLSPKTPSRSPSRPVFTYHPAHPAAASYLTKTPWAPDLLSDFLICWKKHYSLSKNNSSRLSSCSAARPNVTIEAEAEMVQREGSDFWVVSCISSGGRPDADISLALNADEGLRRENSSGPGTQRSSFFLPAVVYEGHSVTCVFDHPKFTHKESRARTLPRLCEYNQCSTSEKLCWGSWGWSYRKQRRVFVSFFLLRRFDWSPVVELRVGRQQRQLPRLWVCGASGRTEWCHHRTGGHWEHASLQHHLHKVRHAWCNSLCAIWMFAPCLCGFLSLSPKTCMVYETLFCT